MAGRNFYEVLGLKNDADDKQIKRVRADRVLCCFAPESATVSALASWERRDVRATPEADGREVGCGQGSRLSAFPGNQAYRKMSRKLHPDMNRKDPNANDKFAELGNGEGWLAAGRPRARAALSLACAAARRRTKHEPGGLVSRSV